MVRLSRALIVSLVGVGVVCALKVWSQDLRATKQNGSVSALKLALRSPKTRLVLHEPLVVVGTLENPEKVSFEIAHPVTSAAGDVRLSVRESGGPGWTEVATFKFGSYSWCGNDREARRLWSVPAGATYGIHEWILFHDGRPTQTEGLAFPKAGTFQVKMEVVFNVGDPNTVSSNLLDVRVEDPQDQDKEALDHLRTTVNGGHVRWQLVMNSGSHHWTQYLEEFVLRFPGSIYGQYASHTLAAGCFTDQPRERIKYWERLAYEDKRPFALRAEAAYRLAEEYKHLNEPGRAQEVRAYFHKTLSEEYETGRFYCRKLFTPGRPWLEK